jgi:hypothetical protein
MANQEEPKQKQKKMEFKIFENGKQCREPKEEPKNLIRPSERDQAKKEKKENE